MTSDIYGYAAYAIMINSAFAEYHGYHLHIATNSSDRDDVDQRWAKVRVMLEMLDHSTETVGEWFVWLDSDLIFLDMGLQLEEVVAQYSHCDLIFSAESQVS
jgi:hypothetical protein